MVGTLWDEDVDLYGIGDEARHEEAHGGVGHAELVVSGGVVGMTVTGCKESGEDKQNGERDFIDQRARRHLESSF